MHHNFHQQENGMYTGPPAFSSCKHVQNGDVFDTENWTY